MGAGAAARVACAVLAVAVVLGWAGGGGAARAEGWRRELLPPEVTAAGAELVAVAGSRDTLVVAVRQGALTTVMSSVDGVRSWQLVARPLRETVRGLATRGGLVLVAVENAWGRRDLWSSSLNAGPWDVVYIRGVRLPGIASLAADSDHIWASDGAALWVSPNARTWTLVAGPSEAAVSGLVATDDGALVGLGPAAEVAHVGLDGALERLGAGVVGCGGRGARVRFDGDRVAVSGADGGGDPAELGRPRGCVATTDGLALATDRGAFAGPRGGWRALAAPDGTSGPPVDLVVYHGWLFWLGPAEGAPLGLWRRI